MKARCFMCEELKEIETPISINGETLCDDCLYTDYPGKDTGKPLAEVVKDKQNEIACMTSTRN